MKPRKSWFFEKISKIDKSLARLMKKTKDTYQYQVWKKLFSLQIL